MRKKLLSFLLTLIMAVGVFSTLSVNAEETQSEDNVKTASPYCDLDNDGEINIKDVTLLQKSLADEDVVLDKDNADADSNGSVNIKDATIMQKYITHQIRTFPGKADHDWRTSSIGYEIFVRSFYDSNGDGCGDFRGVAEKVDYLKSLNVGVVWLMPFNKTGSYHGYDVIDYKNVCEDYGTLEDFKYMVETLHNNGIKVIMDLVVNHTSISHQWFKDSRNNVGNYRDFYVWAETRPFSQAIYWNKDTTAGLYYYYCFNWQMPDLNFQNQDVWAAVDDVADYWLDEGIDGFRLDAAMHIDDNLASDGKHVDNKEDSITHKWWQHFQSHVKTKNPDAFCVGEVWPETAMQKTQQSYFADFDSDFDFYTKTEMIQMANGTTKTLGRLLTTYMTGVESYADSTPELSKETINSLMLSNHDVNRVAYELGGDTDKIKLAANALMTLPGMPWIYYGDELGQSGGGTTGASDVNRREALDWYKTKVGTGMTKMNAKRSWSGTEQFTKANDGISVEEQLGVEGSVLEHYKKLAEIRDKYKIFYTGKCNTSHSFGDVKGYSIKDDNRDYSMFVIHNNKKNSYTLSAACDFTELLTGKSYKAGDDVVVEPLTSMIVQYTDTVPLVAE